MPLSVLVEQRLNPTPLLQENFSLVVRLNSTAKHRFIVDQSVRGCNHKKSEVKVTLPFVKYQ